MDEVQLKLDLDSDFVVVQSNSLAMANYDMSAVEQKLFLIMVSTIQKDDKDIKLSKFRVEDLAEIMGVSTQVLYRDLNKICKNLMSRIVEIRGDNGDWEIFNIVKYSKYVGKEGAVLMEINEKAYPYLLELKEFFSSFALNRALSLNGKYSLRIYQQAKSNIYKGKYIMSLEDFKNSLKLVKKSYNLFSNINLKVIAPSIKEINEKTDITIEVEQIRVGKKVDSLKFIVKPNNQQKVILKSSPTKSNIKNGFNNFEGRQYNHDALEEMALGNVEYNENKIYK